MEGVRFFLEEYRLDAYLHNYPLPIISVMDGISMGGGLGVGLPAQFRIVTERY